MKHRLLKRLLEEQEMKLKGGLYHLTQIKLAYNSNRIEGSRLSDFDYMLAHADEELSEGMIKEFHRLLKWNTSDERKEWFRVGDYKARPNMVVIRKEHHR